MSSCLVRLLFAPLPFHIEGGAVFDGTGAGWQGVAEAVVEGLVCPVPEAGVLPALVLVVAEEA
jgi:hypothetical protein